MRGKKLIILLGILSLLFSSLGTVWANDNRYLEEWFIQGESYYHNNLPYQALDYYVQGYNSEPSDLRFKDGIIKSQRKILQWSLGAHQKGLHSIALVGYSTVVNSPNVDNSLMDLAIKNKARAEAGLSVYGLDHYLMEGNNLLKAGKPYDSLAVFTLANSFFNDARLMDGITKSGNIIMSWSKGGHRAGYFNGALVGYNTLVNNPYISAALKGEAIRLIPIAQQNIRLYTAEEYFKMASAISNPYQALDMYEVANAVYPSDARFVQGIQKHRNTILTWSTSAHNKGYFNAAIIGYERLLKSPTLPISLNKEIQRFRDHALRNRFWYSKDTILALAKKSNPYQALEIYRDSLFLYPNYYTGTVYQGMLDNAKIILSWTKTTHANGGFAAAIKGYQTVLTVGNITDRMYSEAVIGTEIANKGIPYNPDGNYLLQTTYNLSLQEMVEKQNTVGAVRSPIAGETGWVKANTTEIQYYVDPIEAMKRNIYQYLVLSGISGISVEDLNSLLVGKGILEGKGVAFRDAARAYNINEIYLVNHALLETGHGKSQLANGMPYNGTTVYNMFGIGAYDRDPLAMGTQRAYEEGWTTPEKAIIGGAKFIAERYINNASYRQDTLYKMRWNPDNPATHQYATDIGWAEKQGNLMKKYFDNVKSAILRFDIPVFGQN